MQNLGTLDNQYNILERKASGGDRIGYLARHNQTQANYFIAIKIVNSTFALNEI